MRKCLFPAVLAVCFSAALYNCKKTTDILQPTGMLGDTLTIAYNQFVTVDPANLKVAFKSLLGDSRCPTNVICVWQGRADVEIQSTLGSATQIDTMTVGGDINPSDPDTTKAFGYKIRLVDVLPYPLAPDLTPAANYSVKVLVTQ